MNITNQFQKIALFIAQDRFVASLKKMAHYSIPTVVIERIDLLQDLHDARKRCLPHLHQQMNMIYHQNIRIQKIPIPFLIILHPLQITFIILFVLKDSLTVIPSTNNVIQSPRIMYSCFPFHARSNTRGLR